MQLLAAGLLDELHLLVHPIAVRHGQRLFDDGDPMPLRLLESDTFDTGVPHLIYARDDAAPTGDYDDAKAHLRR